MIKGTPNLIIVGPGRGLGSSHNAIWWNLAIFFTFRLKIGRLKDGWTGLWLSFCSPFYFQVIITFGYFYPLEAMSHCPDSQLQVMDIFSVL